MRFFGIFVPSREERDALGGFYLASFVSEVTNIVLPFQFVFLLMVMERPEWAIVPMIVSGLFVFLLEIPTGMIADRYGRKRSVVMGDVLSGLAWMSVPLALLFEGPAQLIVVCLAFALDGLGQTLVSGAEEAWVMDNLLEQDKAEMSEQFFAREKSVSSLGGVISGLLSWLILTVAPASGAVIVTLWIIAGLGQIAAALIELTIPERRIADDADEGMHGSPDFLREVRRAFDAIVRSQPLFVFTVVILLSAFATSVSGDVFEVSMITSGMNPKELAPLTVLNDLLGAIVPLLAVLMSRRIGARNFLVLLLIVPLVAVALLFTAPPLIAIIGLYILFFMIDDLWDPVADAVMHSLIPSSTRAATTSMINQASGLVNLAGLGVFAAMLGEHSAAVADAVPDMIDAFQGTAGPAPQMPDGFLGIPVQETALVVFTIVGALAAPIVALYPWRKRAPQVERAELHLDE